VLYSFQTLGKLQKRLLCPSAYTTIRMKQLGSHWTDFSKILYRELLFRFVCGFQLWLSSYKNKGHLTRRSKWCLSEFFPKWDEKMCWKNGSGTFNVRHIISENRAIYKIITKIRQGQASYRWCNIMWRKSLRI